MSLYADELVIGGNQGVVKMGQAKNRKAAISALKANGPKSRSIVMLGAFYKDDQDDGVSMAFNTLQDPKPGFTKFLYDNLIVVKNDMMAEVKSGEISVDWIWDQLKEAIDAFNIRAFGSAVRPQKSMREVDIAPVMDLIIVIMGNIWILTELGEIQNDDFNGMMFAYQ
jgi:hypothetical protein